jgi:hypothetical protein
MDRANHYSGGGRLLLPPFAFHPCAAHSLTHLLPLRSPDTQSLAAGLSTFGQPS